MISYAEALSRAKANKTDWNERERIAKAIITWVDSEYEYELEIENEGMDDTEFTDWVEKNAEELAKEDAAENSTTLDEVTRIDYETETIDDDAEFEEDYEAWAEFEWECQSGKPGGGSEDFAFVSHEVPTVSMFISAGNAKEGYVYGQHHPKVRFDDSVLYEGSAAYTYMALRWLEEHKA